MPYPLVARKPKVYSEEQQSSRVKSTAGESYHCRDSNFKFLEYELKWSLALLLCHFNVI